eukprot:4331339-Pyramimonas_sp.AAC.1
MEGMRGQQLQRDAPAQGRISDAWEMAKDVLFLSSDMEDHKGMAKLTGQAPSTNGGAGSRADELRGVRAGARRDDRRECRPQSTWI